MNPVRAGVLAGLTVVASVAAGFGPLAVAAPAGLLLAFVLPGYAITAAMFRREIGMVERSVLVPSLSLAVLVLGGLGLWAAGGHLNRAGWTLLCAVVTLIAIGVAFYRHAKDPEETGRIRFRISQDRLIRDVLPLTLAVLLLAGAGVWSYADSVGTYDIRVSTLSAEPPGPAGADGARTVQISATGLASSAGPWSMVLTGDEGVEISRQAITPDTGGDWTGRLTVPGDERVTVNLFRGGETGAFRTLIIAADAQ
ncbi:DUF1616 domain-containing protein [Actinoplanes utahensis]|uniref:DUF1616 domain-containing protein n=1 Tax=Actinoplanes utahensis TaxID=1869 RepID=A0A0A6WZW3_ACTUT|nr:DUF1616 domain-containing protein [Actinoplanes utahensis]KHD73282.1 hypothetical protein MB27_35645 [Actinoplanes utahensis]GIF27434.1 hypothetical protein Aut01nite_04200 [Actinoplanes utahensis]